jgi:hypothetical protein
LQRLLNSKHQLFPEQEVYDRHNRNDSDDYCSTVVCHYNKKCPPPDHIYWNDQHSCTAPPATTRLAMRIVLALIILKKMILLLKTMIIVVSKITVNGVTIVVVVTMPSPTF